MAKSVFSPTGGRDQYHGGSFRADDVTLNWTGGGAKDGALVQRAEWRCQRIIQTIYEIGSVAVYYVGNRRQGTATFSRIVTGNNQFKEFAKKFGDICKPENLEIDAKQAGCGENVTAGGVKYTLVDSLLTELGASVTAQEVVITENMGFQFIDLYYE
jgi:hypothetical protein